MALNFAFFKLDAWFTIMITRVSAWVVIWLVAIGQVYFEFGFLAVFPIKRPGFPEMMAKRFKVVMRGVHKELGLVVLELWIWKFSRVNFGNRHDIKFTQIRAANPIAIVCRDLDPGDFKRILRVVYG